MKVTEAGEIIPKTLQLQTEDQVVLLAHLFIPKVSNQKIVVVNSATGVKQHIYFSLAQYLSSFGFTVITYDYRGIGGSKPEKMKNFQANMRDWGIADFKSVTQYIQNAYPHYKKYAIGHSVGALIVGMNADSQNFEKLVFVATQNAYIGHLTFPTNILAFIGFGILQPLSTLVSGYFPAYLFGLGESLPAGAAFDWRTLILHKHSTNKLLQKIPQEYSKKLQQEVLFIRAKDDTWVTKKGVDSLMKSTYPNMKPFHLLLDPSEDCTNNIGHVNFFRSYNKHLWSNIVDFIS